MRRSRPNSIIVDNSRKDDLRAFTSLECFQNDPYIFYRACGLITAAATANARYDVKL